MKSKHLWVTTPTEVGGVYVTDDKISHASSFAAHTIGWSLISFMIYCASKRWLYGSEFQFKDKTYEWTYCTCPSCMEDEYDYGEVLPEEALILIDGVARKWGFL